MALLTTLFSALARKIGDLLQAIFGWSIAALFGRVSARKQVLISVALILSLFWPIFVLGVFFPAAATFFIAFIPVKELVAANVLRAVWIALALIAPIFVALIIRFVSPDARQKPLFRSLMHGYPLALGFAGAFVITLITVPLVKIATMMRGWKDEHIFMQTKKGHYPAALRNLCEACVMVGLEPQVSQVPKRLTLSMRLIRKLSRGAVESMVIPNPLMIRAKDLEIYLYPADLLLRGKAHQVARIRAVMNRTWLSRDAYMVSSERAQALQDELGRLWDAIGRHHNVDEIGAGLKSRLKEIATESTRSDLTFDEWVLLDQLARRVENKLFHVESIIEEAGLKKTHEQAQLLSGAVREDAAGDIREAKAMRHEAARPERSTAELIETALKETRALMEIELKLAKDEAIGELKGVRNAAISTVVAVISGTLMLAMLGMALVLALGAKPLVAVAVAGGFLVIAVICLLIGRSMVPSKVMPRTRRHLTDDLKYLKEHVA